MTKSGSNDYAYDHHVSLLPLAGLPLILPLPVKVKHGKGDYTHILSKGENYNQARVEQLSSYGYPAAISV